jgi:hypothetical protein
MWTSAPTIYTSTRQEVGMVSCQNGISYAVRSTPVFRKMNAFKYSEAENPRTAKYAKPNR